VKAGFYTQPGTKPSVGKELRDLETAIIETLAKNAETALAMEREAMELDCKSRYYQTHLAMLTDPKQDLTAEKTRERNELIKQLALEAHLTEQATSQKSQLAGLEEAQKILAANLAKFKGVDNNLEKLPEKQNVIGLPIFRERLHKSLSAQEEVTHNRLNHGPFVAKVASEKIRLTDELKKVHGEHETVERQFNLNMTNKHKLEDVCSHRKEILGDLSHEVEQYKQNLDEFMVDYGNMTSQFHGGPSSPMRHINNPHNIIVA